MLKKNIICLLTAFSLLSSQGCSWAAVSETEALFELLAELEEKVHTLQPSQQKVQINPFLGKTSAQIDKMLKGRGYTAFGSNTKTEKHTYLNEKTGLSFHVFPDEKKVVAVSKNKHKSRIYSM